MKILTTNEKNVIYLKMETKDDVNKVAAVIGDLDINDALGIPIGIASGIRRRAGGGRLKQYVTIVDDLLKRKRTF